MLHAIGCLHNTTFNAWFRVTMAGVTDKFDSAQGEPLVELPGPGGPAHHILAAVHYRHRNVRDLATVVKKLGL